MSGIKTLGYSAFVALFSVASAYCQVAATPPSGSLTKQYSPAQIATAQKDAQENQVTGFDLEVLRHIKDVNTLPLLEKAFHSQNDELDKLKAASVLVFLRDTDPTYWNYLAFHAQKAVESDAPNPTDIGPDGKFETPSPEFVSWSQSQGRSLTLELQQVAGLYPAAVGQLADSEEARAVPILREGLGSKVYMIQVVAAMGLANLHDEPSVSAIIDLCKRDPSEVSVALASAALVYFDDAAAQAAVDQYLSKKDADISRQARKDGRTAMR